MKFSNNITDTLCGRCRSDDERESQRFIWVSKGGETRHTILCEKCEKATENHRDEDGRYNSAFFAGIMKDK